LTNRDSNPAGARNVSFLQNIQSGPRAQVASYFPGGKWTEPWGLPSTSFYSQVQEWLEL